MFSCCRNIDAAVVEESRGAFPTPPKKSNAREDHDATNQTEESSAHLETRRDVREAAVNSGESDMLPMTPHPEQAMLPAPESQQSATPLSTRNPEVDTSALVEELNDAKPTRLDFEKTAGSATTDEEAGKLSSLVTSKNGPASSSLKEKEEKAVSLSSQSNESMKLATQSQGTNTRGALNQSTPNEEMGSSERSSAKSSFTLHGDSEDSLEELSPPMSVHQAPVIETSFERELRSTMKRLGHKENRSPEKEDAPETPLSRKAGRINVKPATLALPTPKPTTHSASGPAPLSSRKPLPLSKGHKDCSHLTREDVNAYELWYQLGLLQWRPANDAVRDSSGAESEINLPERKDDVSVISERSSVSGRSSASVPFTSPKRKAKQRARLAPIVSLFGSPETSKASTVRKYQAIVSDFKSYKWDRLSAITDAGGNVSLNETNAPKLPSVNGTDGGGERVESYQEFVKSYKGYVEDRVSPEAKANRTQ